MRSIIFVCVTAALAAETFANECLVALPQNGETAFSIVSYAARPQSVEAMPTCGDSLPINCPGGAPGAPRYFALGLRGITIGATAPFSATAELELTTPVPIPVTIPLVGECTLMIDSRLGSSRTVRVSGTIVHGGAELPPESAHFNSSDLSGLEDADVSISGGIGCSFASFGIGFFNDSIAGYLSSAFTTPLCRECGMSSVGPCPKPRPAFHGDFDGDGKDDLVVRNGATGEITIHLMAGTNVSGGGVAGWAGAAAIAGIGDFNGDGRSDILFRDAQRNLGMWMMNGASIVAGGYVGSLGDTSVEAVADFDGDDRSDILLADRAGNLGLWQMSGATIVGGGFVGSPGGYAVAASRDFNGDGLADILLRDDAGTLGLWMMNGPDVVAGALVGSPGEYSVAATSDFNGDERADILLRDALGNVGMWIMNGATIVSGSFVGSPGAYSVVSSGDYDGNGRADVLLRDTTGALGMWLMNGSAITGGAALPVTVPPVAEIH